MKKYLLLLILLVSVLFTSCEPVTYCMEKEDVENYVEVSLVFYDNPTAPTHKQGSRSGDFSQYDWENFDASKMEVIEILPLTKAEELIKDLETAESFYDCQDINSPNGYCLRIVFENGDYFIESLEKNQGFAARYNSEGQWIKIYGLGFLSASYVNKYFDYQIPTT